MDSQNIDCLFCKISAGTIPSTVRYQDESVIAFDDIRPAAPIHILIIPRQHIPTIDDLEPKDEPLAGKLLYTAQQIAREQGIAQTGYRLVFNVRNHGGQAVDHLHLHLIGGKQLGPVA